MPKALCRSLAALLLLSGVPALAVMDACGRKTFVIARTSSPPLIDGRLDDEVWRHAAVVDDFHQVQPQDGGTPTEDTLVRILYDENFLYIAADLRDSAPDLIRASQIIQGRLFDADDRFFVTVDSFNNKRNDYFFQVNANGVRREALRENNARFIEEWQTIWQARSARHDAGWSTEMAIPFKSISFDPQTDTWGINFGRGITRKQEFTVWSSYERQNWPAYSGEVSGINSIEQGLGLDVRPAIVLRKQNDYDAAVVETGLQPSLDVLYKMTPSLSAAFTINTDFSTTEVDERQIALDRFSLFVPEKRDFFLQDAGIFEFGNIDTNGRPFFSRRIGLSQGGDPVGLDAGAKLTGRIDKFSVGALAIRQQAYEDVAASDLFVARATANVLDESTLGFIATHGDPGSNDDNSLLGADFLYRNSDGVFGQIVQSQLWLQQTRTSGLAGDDSAFGAKFELPNDRISAYLAAMEVQENFNPALGFVNRTGIRQFNAGFRYRTRPESGRWRAINHRIDATLITDMHGDLKTGLTRVRPVSLYSNSGDFLFVEWQRNRENVLNEFDLFGRLPVPAGEYAFDRYRVEIATAEQRPVSVVLSVQDGGFFGGERLEKFAELQWRQSSHFFLGLSYTENDVELPGGSFTSRLASLRGDVAFDSMWSWSNLVQYDNTAAVFGLNSRLRFMPTAGKEVLLVLNHGATIEADNRLQSSSNEILLKFSYTFRY